MDWTSSLLYLLSPCMVTQHTSPLHAHPHGKLNPLPGQLPGHDRPSGPSPPPGLPALPLGRFYNDSPPPGFRGPLPVGAAPTHCHTKLGCCVPTFTCPHHLNHFVLPYLLTTCTGPQHTSSLQAQPNGRMTRCQVSCQVMTALMGLPCRLACPLCRPTASAVALPLPALGDPCPLVHPYSISAYSC